MSVIDATRGIIRLTGSKSEIKHRPLPIDDPKVLCPRIERAREMLGREPTIGLENGAARTVSYFGERARHS